jgi:hypothetical protein
MMLAQPNAAYDSHIIMKITFSDGGMMENTTEYFSWHFPNIITRDDDTKVDDETTYITIPRSFALCQSVVDIYHLEYPLPDAGFDDYDAYERYGVLTYFPPSFQESMKEIINQSLNDLYECSEYLGNVKVSERIASYVYTCMKSRDSVQEFFYIYSPTFTFIGGDDGSWPTDITFSLTPYDKPVACPYYVIVPRYSSFTRCHLLMQFTGIGFAWMNAYKQLPNTSFTTYASLAIIEDGNATALELLHAPQNLVVTHVKSLLMHRILNMTAFERMLFGELVMLPTTETIKMIQSPGQANRDHYSTQLCIYILHHYMDPMKRDELWRRLKEWIVPFIAQSTISGIDFRNNHEMTSFINDLCGDQMIDLSKMFR